MKYYIYNNEAMLFVSSLTSSGVETTSDINRAMVFNTKEEANDIVIRNTNNHITKHIIHNYLILEKGEIIK